MKSIQLSKDQRNKLLELIKHYYPKYEYITIKPTSRYGYDSGMVSLFRGRWSLRGTVIHWYEFLTTKLLPHANAQFFGDSIFVEDCPKGVHVIDYVYSELMPDEKSNM